MVEGRGRRRALLAPEREVHDAAPQGRPEEDPGEELHPLPAQPHQRRTHRARGRLHRAEPRGPRADRTRNRRRPLRRHRDHRDRVDLRPQHGALPGVGRADDAVVRLHPPRQVLPERARELPRLLLPPGRVARLGAGVLRRGDGARAVHAGVLERLRQGRRRRRHDRHHEFRTRRHRLGGELPQGPRLDPGRKAPLPRSRPTRRSSRRRSRAASRRTRPSGSSSKRA